jgi:hypothetical protein
VRKKETEREEWSADESALKLNLEGSLMIRITHAREGQSDVGTMMKLSL